MCCPLLFNMWHGSVQYLQTQLQNAVELTTFSCHGVFLLIQLCSAFPSVSQSDNVFIIPLMAITCKLLNQTSPLGLVFCPNRSLSVPHQVYFVGFVNQFCDGMGLTREQSLLCAEKRELMVGVRYGANLATKQCQYQFQYRRWNCSVPERDANTLFRRITEKGQHLLN